MTNLKDKLSASVRQAKAGQQPAVKPTSPVKPAAPKKPTARKAAVKPAVSKPAAPKRAAPQAVKPKLAEKKPSTPTKPPQSGGADSNSVLFPDRVWPD